MSVRESQKRANAKWDKAHLKQVIIKFYDSNDRDMLMYEHISTYPSKQAYIKSLIEADMLKKEK